MSIVAKRSPISATAEHLFSVAEDISKTQTESFRTEVPNSGGVLQ